MHVSGLVGNREGISDVSRKPCLRYCKLSHRDMAFTVTHFLAIWLSLVLIPPDVRHFGLFLSIAAKVFL